MRCKGCGKEIKQSGECWVSDISLAQKAKLFREYEWDLDAYRIHSIFCNFNPYQGVIHQPSESSKVLSVVTRYEVP